MGGDPAQDGLGAAAGEAPAATDEERLVVEAQRGSIDAFNRLVRLYERQVYNVALRTVGHPDQAEDVTQDTFLLAYKSLHQFRGGIFRAWLLRIATNRCYDELRRRQRRPAGSFDELSFEPRTQWSTLPTAEEPHERAERLELSGLLEAALRQLPDDQRVVVVLSDIQGYSYDEIAAATGVSLGTIKSRLSRGRGRLREILREHPRSGELFARYWRRYEEERGSGGRPAG
ncbi:MAG: sigma-70 family RNA polymerase sigma factor [Chloroflexota bacterium]|nr:sigma-70 family RNA polymerase sigma factor [Chloroflexota bacterium]